MRFATGDLSAVMPGPSPCGRTNARIKGWMGRADQTTKIKGMFVRPEQVADFVGRHTEISAARVIATRDGEQDAMRVQVVADGGDEAAWADSITQTLKLRGLVERVSALPNDGLVIEDQRDYG
jgi:phenylacetate-CoA ligase